MKRRRPVFLLTGVVLFFAVLVIAGIELTRGLSLTRELHSLGVKEMYIMSDKGMLYLSIDLDPSASHVHSIRVPLEQISFAVNPALATDMTISSTDYIWGDRWPWVENVTITLKTARQKEGFAQLLKPEKLKQMQADLDKGTAAGVTHAGLLTSGGRILD